jgi:hypothetical protein
VQLIALKVFFSCNDPSLIYAENTGSEHRYRNAMEGKMEKVDHVIKQLEKDIGLGQDARKKMSQDALDTGPTYVMKWGDRMMKLEARARVADTALVVLKDKGLDHLKEFAVERALETVGYVIADNSFANMAEQLFQAQAWAALAKELKFA